MAEKCPKFPPTRKFRDVPIFLTRMISLRNYASSKNSSYKIMRMKIFATKDKAKPQQGNVKAEILGGGGGQACEVSVGAVGAVDGTAKQRSRSDGCSKGSHVCTVYCFEHFNYCVHT